MQRRVILAAGHGGGDSGAVWGGRTEASECVALVNGVAELLRADGQVECVVVPHELGLQDTINWINARYGTLDAGMCLETHRNSCGGCGASGVEVWFYGGDAQSQSYAQSIQAKLAAVTGLPSRGVKPDTSNRHGRLGFVRDTIPWAELIEAGFIETDGGLWPLAQGIFEGALSLWGLAPKPVAPPAPQPEPPKPDTPKYRVYDSAGKQIGAYNTEDSAWNKYQTGGAKIVETASGRDVTPDFVAKYRPVVPQPAPDAEPHPELDDLNRRVSSLEKLVQTILAYLMRWKRFREFMNRDANK